MFGRKGHYEKKANKKKPESRGERSFNIVVNLLGVIISLVALYPPIFYVVIASFSQPFYVDNGDVMFWFKGFNFESYKQAVTKDGIWMAYANTLFYTFGGVAVNMIFTATMAYALSKQRLILRRTFTFMAMFTMWFNAGMIPFYMTFVDLNLLDTRTAVILGFAINTYNLIILKSFFEQVPASLEEAAFMDGASNIQIFSKIYLPLSKPALATVGMFYAVTRWNGYFWAMNLLRDDNKVPLQVLLKKINCR